MPTKIPVFVKETGKVQRLFTVDAREAVRLKSHCYAPEQCDVAPSDDDLVMAGYNVESKSKKAISAHTGLPEEAADLVAQELDPMGVPQLREIAKNRGITGYSSMTKPQLIQALTVGRGQEPGDQTQMIEEEEKASANQVSA